MSFASYFSVELLSSSLNRISLCLFASLQLSAQPLELKDPSSLLFAEDLQAPAEFQKQLSSSRSPLLKKDGSRVKSAEEWAKQRAELESEWHQIMGAWPAKIEKPGLEILKTSEREGVIQHEVKVEVARGQWLQGYLLQPKLKGALPAVFVPFYEPETSVALGGKPLRDFALQLAKRGMVTLALGTPGGNAYAPVLSEDANCQPLSYYGYISGNVYRALAQQSFVDPKRIGIMGHSYGGKWAMFGACFNSEYACGVWSDPGVEFDDSRPSVNYWEPWYLGLDAKQPRVKRGLITPENPSTGAYKVLREKGHSLAEVQSFMAPRPFFVSGGAEDGAARWKELNHVRQVYDLLGLSPRFGLSLRPMHDPTVVSNEKIYAFFEWVFSSSVSK